MRMRSIVRCACCVIVLAAGVATFAQTAPEAVSEDRLPTFPMNVNPKPITSDPAVKYDYDIVYVRAPRFVPGRDGKPRPSAWPEIAHPTNINAGYDLMLLHPDGSEEVLVAAGEGSIADPYVSFDAQWVYYAHFYLGKVRWTACPRSPCPAARHTTSASSRRPISPAASCRRPTR